MAICTSWEPSFVLVIHPVQTIWYKCGDNICTGPDTRYKCYPTRRPSATSVSAIPVCSFSLSLSQSHIHIDSQSHMGILNHLFSHIDPQPYIQNHRSYSRNHKNTSTNTPHQESVQREVRKGEEEEP
jgi:hypothetical protein